MHGQPHIRLSEIFESAQSHYKIPKKLG